MAIRSQKIKKIGIVGGGIAGLTSSFLLHKKGFEVTLFEKKSYPFHRVCGEYLSREVEGFLTQNQLLPKSDLPKISKFLLSSVNGKTAEVPLKMGGLGLSRYLFDFHLYQKCVEAGVDIRTNSTVRNIIKIEEEFEVETEKNKAYFDLIIGSFGKKSILDNSLERSFTTKPAPYIGVKYHIKTDFPDDLVALHNFPGGYCGMSKIENETYNLCYLGTKSDLRKHGNIDTYEKNVVFQNPFLKSVFQNSTFVFKKPVVINEVSFATKEPIEDGVLMVGDAAGLITPLNGNGMAMAVRAAKMVTTAISENASDIQMVYNTYRKSWTKEFRFRLNFGRNIQSLFGSKGVSNFAVNLLNSSSFLADQIVRQTHGKTLR